MTIIRLKLTYDNPTARDFVLVHERTSRVARAWILPYPIFLLRQGSEHLVVLELVC